MDYGLWTRRTLHWGYRATERVLVGRFGREQLAARVPAAASGLGTQLRALESKVASTCWSEGIGRSL